MDDRVFLWDWLYYNRLWRANEFSFDEDQLSEYFELQNTLSIMFGMFERLLGMSFKKVNKEEFGKHAGLADEHRLTWHPEVELYTVWDSDSETREFLGYLYLSLVLFENSKARHSISHARVYPVWSPHITPHCKH